MRDHTATSRTTEIRRAWSPVERYMRAIEGQRRRDALVTMLCGNRPQRDPSWDAAEWAVGAMSPADVRRFAC